MSIFVLEPRRGGLVGEAWWGRARRPWERWKGHRNGSAYPGVSLHVGMPVRLGGTEKGAQDQALLP